MLCQPHGGPTFITIINNILVENSLQVIKFFEFFYVYEKHRTPQYGTLTHSSTATQGTIVRQVKTLKRGKLCRTCDFLVEALQSIFYGAVFNKILPFL